ncbi:hypothetical protein AOLI_G00033240 [Acnodon oligacanthus]
MGGKEKKIVNIANPSTSNVLDRCAGGRDSKCGCSDAVSSLLQPACVKKRAADEEVFRGSVSSASRLDFFRHLERVETLRCYWELKHVQASAFMTRRVFARVSQGLPHVSSYVPSLKTHSRPAKPSLSQAQGRS